MDIRTNAAIKRVITRTGKGGMGYMITQEDFTDEERYKMNVKMAVSLIKHLHKEGKITDKAMEKIEKDAKKRIENYR